MPWLGMALISEGTSDDLFLPDVLRRSAQEICGPGTDVPEPIVVRASAGPATRDRLVRELERREGAFNLVVYHRDGASDPDREIDTWVTPFREAFLAGHRDPVVAVIPVRETEAWAMADGDALRAVLGVSWPDDRMGLPRRRPDVEAVRNPKESLRGIVEKATSWDVEYLNRLGERVSLGRLRELLAFQRWENDLAEALRTLPGFVER